MPLDLGRGRAYLDPMQVVISQGDEVWAILDELAGQVAQVRQSAVHIEALKSLGRYRDAERAEAALDASLANAQALAWGLGEAWERATVGAGVRPPAPATVPLNGGPGGY